MFCRPMSLALFDPFGLSAPGSAARRSRTYSSLSSLFSLFSLFSQLIFLSMARPPRQMCPNNEDALGDSRCVGLTEHALRLSPLGRPRVSSHTEPTPSAITCRAVPSMAPAQHRAPLPSLPPDLPPQHCRLSKLRQLRTDIVPQTTCLSFHG